jgi:KTSC domain-containing protein
MRRKSVDSETITSIGYQRRRHELDIEFRESGEVYRYFDVSPEEHAQFMSADSKGGYLNRVFKAEKHPYIVVKRKRH